MKHGPTQRIAGIRGPVRETAGGENTNEQKALGGTNYGLLSSPWYEYLDGFLPENWHSPP